LNGKSHKNNGTPKSNTVIVACINQTVQHRARDMISIHNFNVHNFTSGKTGLPGPAPAQTAYSDSSKCDRLKMVRAGAITEDVH
jgi:hypothetical protein